MGLSNIPIVADERLPKDIIFFFNPDTPPGVKFKSIEEKLEWMAKNGRLTMMMNVGELPWA